MVSVPASGVLAGTGENWTTQSGTTHLLDLGGQGIRAIQWCAEVDGSGKFLIIGGPPSTDRAGDHPSVGRFSLWSWAGSGSSPVLRIADLAPYARYPSGVATFTIPNVTEPRVIFAEGDDSGSESLEWEHLPHWRLSILD